MKKIKILFFLCYILFTIVGSFLWFSPVRDNLSFFDPLWNFQTKTKIYAGIPIFSHPKLDYKFTNYCFGVVSEIDKSESLVYSSKNCEHKEVIYFPDFFDFEIKFFLYSGISRYWLLMGKENPYDESIFYEMYYKKPDPILNTVPENRRHKIIQNRKDFYKKFNAASEHFCRKHSSDKVYFFVTLRYFNNYDKEFTTSHQNFFQYNCNLHQPISEDWQDKTQWRFKAWKDVSFIKK